MVYIKWPDNFPKPADQEWSGNKRQTTWKTGPLSLVFGDKEQHIVGQRIFQEWWQKAVEKGYEGEAAALTIDGKVVITLGKWQWVIEKDEEGWKIDGPSAIQNLNEKALTSSGRLQPSFDFTNREEAVMAYTTSIDVGREGTVKSDKTPGYTPVPEGTVFHSYEGNVLFVQKPNKWRLDSSKPNVANTPKRCDGTTGAEKVVGVAEKPPEQALVNSGKTPTFSCMGPIPSHRKKVENTKEKISYVADNLTLSRKRVDVGMFKAMDLATIQQQVWKWLNDNNKTGEWKMKFNEDNKEGWAEKVDRFPSLHYSPSLPHTTMTPEFHENDEWLSVAEWSKNRAGWREYGNCKVFSQGFAGGIHDYLWANQIEGAWKTVAASRVPYYFGVKVPGVVGSLRAFAKGFVKTSTTSNEIKKIIKETPLFQVGSLCTAEWVDATKMWDSANNQLVDKKVAVKDRNNEMNQAKLLLNYLNDKGLEGEWQLIVGDGVFWGEQYE